MTNPIKRMKRPITLEHAQAVVDEVMVGKDKKIADLQKQIERLEGWRCFHCDEVFKTKERAETHFGATECSPTVCQIDGQHLRDLEKQLERYRNEDTDLHRQIASMEGQHQQALMRGYAKGLKDYTKSEQERDSLKSQLAAAEKERDANSQFASTEKRWREQLESKLAAAEAKGEALRGEVMEWMAKCGALSVYLENSRCSCYHVRGQEIHGANKIVQCPRCKGVELLNDPPSTFLREYLKPVRESLKKVEIVVHAGCVDDPQYEEGLHSGACIELQKAIQLLSALTPRNEETK